MGWRGVSRSNKSLEKQGSDDFVFRWFDEESTGAISSKKAIKQI